MDYLKNANVKSLETAWVTSWYIRNILTSVSIRERHVEIVWGKKFKTLPIFVINSLQNWRLFQLYSNRIKCIWRETRAGGELLTLSLLLPRACLSTPGKQKKNYVCLRKEKTSTLKLSPTRDGVNIISPRSSLSIPTSIGSSIPPVCHVSPRARSAPSLMLNRKVSIRTLHGL